MQESTDTIFARATPPGEGAIAIIRISGPETSGIIKKCFKCGNPNHVKYNHLALGVFINPNSNEMIDEVFCVSFQKPHSYTGEDSAEIHCHGGPAIVTGIMDVLSGLNARMAEPGEFTKRAFLNGKMDLTKAEAVCDLIRSQTDKAAIIALNQLQGGLQRKIESVKELTITAGTEIEARLDFPEEDLGEKDNVRLLESLDQATFEIRELIKKGTRLRIFTKGARVVLLGKPNTGKSSLFNALLKIDRAIVTPHPGTTRDSIESTVDLRGCPVSYVDTAGIRRSDNEVELLGIKRTKKEVSQAQLSIFLIDLSTPLGEEDYQIFELVSQKPFILALNKTDLASSIDKADLKPFMEKALVVVSTSALTGEGIETLEEAIADQIIGNASPTEDGFITNERHLGLLRKSLESLEKAHRGVQTNFPEELIMVDIREALHSLSRITGEEVNGEILDAVFQRFCIGK